MLVAGAAGAQIGSTAGGTSVSIPTVWDVLINSAPDDHSASASRAWVGSLTQCYQAVGGPEHFAAHLARILGEAARERAYDGLIVVADPQMASALHRSLTPETHALLIGEVIRDLHSVPVEDPAAPLALRH